MAFIVFTLIEGVERDIAACGRPLHPTRMTPDLPSALCILATLGLPPSLSLVRRDCYLEEMVSLAERCYKQAISGLVTDAMLTPVISVCHHYDASTRHILTKVLACLTVLY